MNIQERINEYFNTVWYVEDFIEGYKRANNIEDRELTDSEMKNFEEKMTEGFLKNFRETIIGEVNERMTYIL